jgi:hypothetical protein
MIDSAGARGGAILRDADPIEAEMTMLFFALVCREVGDRPLVPQAPIFQGAIVASQPTRNRRVSAQTRG